MAGGAVAAASCIGRQQDLPKPNIVFILADDLGWGDLGCYGQQRFTTPNIDALASDGILFTQCYSGTTVSAPSRSCLRTDFTCSFWDLMPTFRELTGQKAGDGLDGIRWTDRPDIVSALQSVMQDSHIPNPAFPVLKGE